MTTKTEDTELMTQAAHSRPTAEYPPDISGTLPGGEQPGDFPPIDHELCELVIVDLRALYAHGDEPVAQLMASLRDDNLNPKPDRLDIALQQRDAFRDAEIDPFNPPADAPWPARAARYFELLRSIREGVAFRLRSV